MNKSQIPKGLGAIKTDFIEQFPRYGATMYPVRPTAGTASIWREDPNNDDNNENWDLEWPPEAWDSVDEDVDGDDDGGGDGDDDGGGDDGSGGDGGGDAGDGPSNDGGGDRHAPLPPGGGDGGDGADGADNRQKRKRSATPRKQAGGDDDDLYDDGSGASTDTADNDPIDQGEGKAKGSARSSKRRRRPRVSGAKDDPSYRYPPPEGDEEDLGGDEYERLDGIERNALLELFEGLIPKVGSSKKKRKAGEEAETGEAATEAGVAELEEPARKRAKKNVENSPTKRAVEKPAEKKSPKKKPVEKPAEKSPTKKSTEQKTTEMKPSEKRPAEKPTKEATRVKTPAQGPTKPPKSLSLTPVPIPTPRVPAKTPAKAPAKTPAKLATAVEPETARRSARPRAAAGPGA